MSMVTDSWQGGESVTNSGPSIPSAVLPDRQDSESGKHIMPGVWVTGLGSTGNATCTSSSLQKD